jgi:hypothetical protein
VQWPSLHPHSLRSPVIHSFIISGRRHRIVANQKTEPPCCQYRIYSSALFLELLSSSPTSSTSPPLLITSIACDRLYCPDSYIRFGHTNITRRFLLVLSTTDLISSTARVGHSSSWTDKATSLRPSSSYHPMLAQSPNMSKSATAARQRFSYPLLLRLA